MLTILLSFQSLNSLGHFLSCMFLFSWTSLKSLIPDSSSIIVLFKSLQIIMFMIVLLNSLCWVHLGNSYCGKIFIEVVFFVFMRVGSSWPFNKGGVFVIWSRQVDILHCVCYYSLPLLSRILFLVSLLLKLGWFQMRFA